MEFTFIQLENWRRYEATRRSGLYNMFDPRARLSTGLNKDEYLFCIENYSELREAVEADGGL